MGFGFAFLLLLLTVDARDCKFLGGVFKQTCPDGRTRTLTCTCCVFSPSALQTPWTLCLGQPSPTVPASLCAVVS